MRNYLADLTRSLTASLSLAAGAFSFSLSHQSWTSVLQYSVQDGWMLAPAYLVLSSDRDQVSFAEEAIESLKFYVRILDNRKTDFPFPFAYCYEFEAEGWQ
ncbi:hypothetical protein [Janthinobacterium sp. PC23-8]|uniref:hypothetical protein n=1 Tax=Janthinobacterium sp. PC23-8 TaxID=2012679 RepID=UPI000B9751E2|nr:hypothetical protein [Janthinobacterium sp. PC23-8]OYO29768.1 hypothetical protein CD932_00425 [Janthinobacterium sp. PC23-8]